MKKISLEDVITVLNGMDAHPAREPVYINSKNWLDDRIQKVCKYIFTNPVCEFIVVFRNKIDFDKLKIACKNYNHGYSIGFFGNDDTLCLNYDGNLLKPVCQVEKAGTITFIENEKQTALSIINAYLKETEKEH